MVIFGFGGPPVPAHSGSMKLFRILLAMVASSLLSDLPARAEVTITAVETDGDVVLVFSGRLDTTGLVDGPNTSQMGRVKPGSPPFLLLGVDVQDRFAPRPGLGGPSSFGSGGNNFTLVATGDIFGMDRAS